MDSCWLTLELQQAFVSAHASCAALGGWDKAFETAHETVAETVPIFHDHPVIGSGAWKLSWGSLKRELPLLVEHLGSSCFFICSLLFKL